MMRLKKEGQQKVFVAMMVTPELAKNGFWGIAGFNPGRVPEFINFPTEAWEALFRLPDGRSEHILWGRTYALFDEKSGEFHCFLHKNSSEYGKYIVEGGRKLMELDPP